MDGRERVACYYYLLLPTARKRDNRERGRTRGGSDTAWASRSRALALAFACLLLPSICKSRASILLGSRPKKRRTKSPDPERTCGRSASESGAPPSPPSPGFPSACMDDERWKAPPSSASAARQLSQPTHFAWFPSSPDRAAAPPRPGPSPPSVKPADALDDELASLALPASTLFGAAEDDGTPRALARASAPFAVSSVPTATPRRFAPLAQSSTTDAGFDLLAKQEASSAARTAYASAAEPPSPLALPGSWRGGGRIAPFATQRTRSDPSRTDDGEAGLRWRLVPRRREETREDEDGGEEDEALLLPPPFLDEDSPRETFDGQFLHCKT